MDLTMRCYRARCDARVIASSSLSGPPSEIVILDSTPERYASILRPHYVLRMTAQASAAVEYLRGVRPAAVIADLDVEDSFAVCKAARLHDDRPAILVTAADAEKVPEALLAGCDSVLVKPFAPNLLIARISRLLRGRSADLRMRSAHQRLKVDHLLERSAELISGTNRIWPDKSCPHCAHPSVTSFDHASHRKAWYACLACRKVWMAKMVG